MQSHALGLTILLAAAGPVQATCAPHVAGPTVNWAVAVCQSRIGTDDFGNPDVQKCLQKLVRADALRGKDRELCRVNAKYKQEICRAYVAQARNMTTQACIESTDTIPTTVSQGVGN
jgi:hypothetical protein